MGRILSKALFIAFVTANIAVANAANDESVFFEIYEDFDNDEHFTTSTTMPDGWVSYAPDGQVAFKRRLASDMGITAPSGDYVVVTPNTTSYGYRHETIFSPMMTLAGGTKCSVSFSYLAPGHATYPLPVGGLPFKVAAGTAQTLDAQTIEIASMEAAKVGSWTEYYYTFIVPEDGEYCISLGVNDELQNTGRGLVALDNISIVGCSHIGTNDYTFDFTPDPENLVDTVEIPYLEQFEGDNYDGTSYLPVKWQCYGTAPFVTANITDFAAQSGSWYLIADESDYPHDEHLYTPFFSLEAGIEYNISYYIYMPGHEWAKGTWQTTDVDFMVGVQQESDFQASIQKTTNYYNSGWELKKYTFIPPESGAYCFSWALNSESYYSGCVAIDDFYISADELVLLPQPRFTTDHIYDYANSCLLVYEHQKVQLVNLSEKCDSYRWSVTDGAEISDTTAENPIITFSAAGQYDVTLKGINSGGDREVTRRFNVTYVPLNEEKLRHSITTYNTGDEYLEVGDVPTLPYDERDYITGPNSLYKVYAEKFIMPNNRKVKLRTINLWRTNLHYRVVNNSYNNQANAPFHMVFYGERNGKPDENNVYGEYTATMKDVFGETQGNATHSDPVQISLLDQDIEVDGNFYLAIVFDDNFIIERDPDIYVGRSYLGLVADKHASGVTTLYVKPYKVPEGSSATVNHWCRLDQLMPRYAGYGMHTVVWVDSYSKGSGIVALDANGEVAYAATSDNGDIIVSGTNAGDSITLYSTAGVIQLHATAKEGSTRLNTADLPAGVYMVVTPKGVLKVMK
jgi:PKD repeat protein